MEQLQQGFSDSTPMAGSDRLQNFGKDFLLKALKLISNKRPKVWIRTFLPFLNCKLLSEESFSENF